MKRRDFIKSTAAAAGIAVVNPTIAADHSGHLQHKQLHDTGKSFDASNEPPRLRKSFYDLTDEELQNFMRAVGYVRNTLKLEDPTMWDNYARQHAFHCTEMSDTYPAVHWSWNFLPWHRAYLYFMERILANALTVQGYDGTKFAMPYWDWSLHKTMPNTKLREARGQASPFFGYDPALEDMTADDGLGFDNSALYDGNRGPSVQKPQMDPANELTQESKDHVAECLAYMSTQYVELMLSTPWEQFLGSPVTDRSTGQGLLEQGPHNDGHDWVGSRFGKNRTMGTLRTAAADPMFYMHHGNIDRIWDLYTQPQPDPTGPWGEQQYNFTDIDGSTITMSVQQIIQDLTNVKYDTSKTGLRASRKLNTAPFSTVAINKTVGSLPVAVTVPSDVFNNSAVTLQFVTGPISYTGKYAIRVRANGKTIAKINFLDGDHRESNQNPNLEHTFNSIAVNVPRGTTKIELVPPKRGTVDILVKQMRYRSI